MLIAGSAQAYEDDPSLNDPNEKVGEGIYCSPHIQDALDYSEAVSVPEL